MNKSLGQIGYEAYCSTTKWKSLVSGAQLPEWKDVRIQIQLAWETVGEAMVYAERGEAKRLRDLIGEAPEGSHPSEREEVDRAIGENKPTASPYLIDAAESDLNGETK